MDFIDSHCHFDFADFDADREAVWNSCLAANIKQMVVPGVSVPQWPVAAALSKRWPGIYYAVGMHPWWAGEFVDADSLRTQLKAAVLTSKCVALGECGLDAFTETPMAHQLVILRVHLQLAAELNMPLIIHCRKAHNELLSCLKDYVLPAGGVIHAFSGSLEMAQQYWAKGFYLGIGGTITYERAHKTREAVRQISLRALLLESDAPDMPLCGEQGMRNSPANLIKIAQALADLRGDSLANIAMHTTQNAHRLFKFS